jgi:hypothetical protein
MVYRNPLIIQSIIKVRQKMAHTISTRKEATGLKKGHGSLSGLQEKARLEDIQVMKESLITVTKSGERREYWRWVAAWMVDGKSMKVHVGSCRKMSQAEALQKARAMKAESVAIKA